MNQANELKVLIFARTNLKPNKLVCPREKSAITPCVCRDGSLAETNDGKHCIGCGADIYDLLHAERKKHAPKEQRKAGKSAAV